MAPYDRHNNNIIKLGLSKHNKILLFIRGQEQYINLDLLDSQSIVSKIIAKQMIIVFSPIFNIVV